MKQINIYGAPVRVARIIAPDVFGDEEWHDVAVMPFMPFRGGPTYILTLPLLSTNIENDTTSILDEGQYTEIRSSSVETAIAKRLFRNIDNGS